MTAAFLVFMRVILCNCHHILSKTLQRTQLVYGRYHSIKLLGPGLNIREVISLIYTVSYMQRIQFSFQLQARSSQT